MRERKLTGLLKCERKNSLPYRGGQCERKKKKLALLPCDLLSWPGALPVWDFYGATGEGREATMLSLASAWTPQEGPALPPSCVLVGREEGER